MPITVDQVASAQGSGSASQTATFGANPQAGGKAIVKLWGLVGTSVSVSSIVDNGSPQRTFTQSAIKGDSAGTSCWIFFADNIQPTASAYTVTVTLNGSGDINFDVVVLQGAASGAAIATNTGTNTGTAVSSGAAGSGNGNYYAGVFTDGSGLDPETITDNWTSSTRRLTQTNGNTQQAGAANDLIGNGSQTAAWTLGDSVAWWAAIAAYAPAVTAVAQIAHAYGPN